MLAYGMLEHGNYIQPTSGAALSTPEQAKLADILFFDLMEMKHCSSSVFP
jgi:hypothetical protein